MKNKNPSILEVAKVAGVSPATVSRVLNNNLKVDPLLKNRVLEAVKELGYRTNYYAKALIEGKTNFIGMVLTRFEIRHYSSIVYGIESVLNKAGYRFFVTSGRYSHDRELEKIQLFLDLNFTGIIIVSVGLTDDEIVKLAGKGKPILIYDRLVRGLERNCIYYDNFENEKKITSLLIKYGHRKIAHITGPLSLPVYLDRKNGFISALADAGLKVFEDLICTCDQSTIDYGYRATLDLIKKNEKFTALVCQNDPMAIGAISAINSYGLKVPDDISVVGFNDVPESRYITPPLTTVSFKNEQVGYLIGKKMLDMINGIEISYKLPKFEIIERKSVRKISKGDGN